MAISLCLYFLRAKQAHKLPSVLHAANEHKLPSAEAFMSMEVVQYSRHLLAKHAREISLETHD